MAFRVPRANAGSVASAVLLGTVLLFLQACEWRGHVEATPLLLFKPLLSSSTSTSTSTSVNASTSLAAALVSQFLQQKIDKYATLLQHTALKGNVTIISG